LSERLLDLSALAAEEAEREHEEPLSLSQPGSERWDWLFCSALVTGFSLLAYANIHGALFQPLWMAAEAHRWGHLIVRPSILVLALGAALLVFRTVFWLRYRPFPSSSLAAAPSHLRANFSTGSGLESISSWQPKPAPVAPMLLTQPTEFDDSTENRVRQARRRYRLRVSTDGPGGRAPCL
jgi:hypothetical protein